jgi:hypothetical protein
MAESFSEGHGRVTTAPPKNREIEAAKARERAALRYGAR